MGSLPYSRNMSNPMWDGTNVMVWMGTCGLKQNLGGITPIAPEILVVPDLLGLLLK